METKSHLLVWLDADPISPYTIQRTKTMAGLMNADWTVLYVETGQTLDDQKKKQLADNIKLIRRCGGELLTFTGNDPVKACMEIAHRENITHIIVERFKQKKIFSCAKQKLINRLVKESGKINVYVIGTETVATNKKWKYIFPRLKYQSYKYKMIALTSAVMSLFGVSLSDKTEYWFLPFIVLLGLFVMTINFRIHIKWFLASLAVFILIALMLPPRFLFPFDIPSDILPSFIDFSVAFIVGVFAIRFKEQQEQTALREKQTNALFFLTKKLSDITDIQEITNISIENIYKYFLVDAFFIFQGNNQLSIQNHIPRKIPFVNPKLEMEAATRAFKHDEITGRFTDSFPLCEYTYYPLKGASLRMGVIAVKQNEPFTGNTSLFWDAFLAQIAQSMEHCCLEQLARKTNLLVESDKLYKTLFNSISHELRIPVATIMGASDILLTTDNPEHVKTELYGEMLKASQRLNRLIENLLNMSRLESGRIAVHLDWFDIPELFNSVKENLEEELRSFRLVTAVPKLMPLVKLDFGLMEQVIYNLVYNSCLYATPGTTICLRTFYKNGQLVILVMDRGPGFEPKDLPRAFDKFWRYKYNKTGGIGLGLPIVKGFIEAHKGTVVVENRKTGGARFTISIPTKISNGDRK